MGASFGHDECEPKWTTYPRELGDKTKNADKEILGLVLCWICNATFEFGITKREWDAMVSAGTARKEPQT